MTMRHSKTSRILIAAVAVMIFSLPLSGKAWAGAEPFVGEIEAVGFNFAPVNWALCQGQLLPISQYTALFSLLGTTYGGDGRTTFALPDLRGRVAVGQGNGFIMGQIGGTTSATLQIINLPPHNHTASTTVTVTGTAGIPAVNTDGTTDTPASNAVLARMSRNNQYSTATPNVTMTAGPITANASATTTVGMTGGGQPFSIMQPYQVVNYIIALNGIFPSRP